ncbi:MAG: molybdopterin molybdotransferase MoeA [candidate division Zixibacteria bacterium]|nr:molybdopterin molybdotransferase MoeA [candidate division Zixibacteria bacterium]
MTSRRIRQVRLETLQRRVLAAVRPVGTESILIERSRGRILAETIRATAPSPAMDKSVMDGFAVRHADLTDAAANHPVSLRIDGTIPAGHSRSRPVSRGTAVRIMTGAPLPPKADCVVKVEDTSEADGMVRFTKPATRRQNVLRRGTNMRKGQIILRSGTTIAPAHMAMLAFLDQRRVTVYRRPKVGILTTGDELGEVGRRHPAGHVPDSNRYGLIGLIESTGCEPVDGGRCADLPEQLERALGSLARRCGFIVSTGGVSAGDYDVVKILFRQKGGVDLFRLPMKPGKPQAFGHVRGTPFFGLPGNPVSCMVVFDVVIRPALRKLAGSRETSPVGWPAVAAADFSRKSRQWEFPRVRAAEQDGQWSVWPVRSQRSSDLTSMTDADGYVILTPSSAAPKTGDTVRFVPFVV